MQRLGLLASFGAIIGSLFRYWTSELINNSNFPWATLTVNILGSFLIGLFLASPVITAHDNRRVFFITGILGGFTTFSTFAVETLQLSPQLAVLYIFSSILLGTLAALIGFKFKKAQV